jgi:endonuclease IV
MAHEQDILNGSPSRPPRLTSRRIGIHTSSAGGVQNAAERAYRLGCNTFQIFSSSPRQWTPYELGESQCSEMNRLRATYDLKPLVIHTNYLVNLASSNQLFLEKSMEAFRGEVERALSLCAEYLVLHPGSFRGADREQGLLRHRHRHRRVHARARPCQGRPDHPDREHRRIGILARRKL